MGLRDWRTRFELNRCTPDSVDPPRRVDQGATPILDWDGPPHAPNGIGLIPSQPTGEVGHPFAVARVRHWVS